MKIASSGAGAGAIDLKIASSGAGPGAWSILGQLYCHDGITALAKFVVPVVSSHRRNRSKQYLNTKMVPL